MQVLAGEVLGGVGATGGGMLLGAAAVDAATGPTLEELNAGKPSHGLTTTRRLGTRLNNAERVWTELSDEDYAVVDKRQALDVNVIRGVIALVDHG